MVLKSLKMHSKDVLMMTRNNDSMKMDMAFIIVFALAFALAAFTFAFEFRALQRISPDSLQGLPTHTFLDFLFLSTMWLCTSSAEGVVAASSAAPRASRSALAARSMLSLNSDFMRWSRRRAAAALNSAFVSAMCLAARR
jgi:hypothetical protein